MAGRGWRVLVAQAQDLASHTSALSTKLTHGGLRNLDYYEFALVRKALQERARLLKSAPHIIWPLRFVLPGSAGVVLRRSPLAAMLGTPLKPQYTRGFVYSDGWVDDARLVLLNALDARVLGTTDVELAPAALTGFAKAQIEASEIDYPCAQAGQPLLRQAAHPRRWGVEFCRCVAAAGRHCG